MCQVIMARAAMGLNDAGSALECVSRAFAANSSGEGFWRALAHIAALEAHLMSHNVPEIRDSSRRLLRLSQTLREQTWKAIALSACARAAARTGQPRLARQYSDSALELVHSGRLPLAKWRVEATAAELTGDSQSDRTADNAARHLRLMSKQSREKLFSSLATQDPLRSFAKGGFGSRQPA
jgi:hypothetical protein